jgi:hypothetical protein
MPSPIFLSIPDGPESDREARKAEWRGPWEEEEEDGNDQRLVDEVDSQGMPSQELERPERDLCITRRPLPGGVKGHTKEDAEENDTEPGKNGGIIDAVERGWLDPDPEQEGTALKTGHKRPEGDDSGTEEEICPVHSGIERRKKDGKADEVKDPENDVTAGKEEPGHKGDAETEEEDKSAPAEILEDKIPV